MFIVIWNNYLINYFYTERLKKIFEEKISNLPHPKAQVPLGRIFFPIVYNRDKFRNREQSETNRNDECAMCDCLSEYLRTCY